MGLQRDSGHQVSILRFQQKGQRSQQEAAASNLTHKPNKKQSDSTLLKLLGNSNSSKACQPPQSSRVPTSNLQSAVTAAPPPRPTAKQPKARSDVHANSTYVLSNPVAFPQKHHTGSGRHRQPGPQLEASAVADCLQPCPLCGQQLSPEQLQQHVDAELAELELQDSPQKQPCRTGHQHEQQQVPVQQQQQQQQHDQHQAPVQQQQQGMQDSCGVGQANGACRQQERRQQEQQQHHLWPDRGGTVQPPGKRHKAMHPPQPVQSHQQRQQQQVLQPIPQQQQQGVFCQRGRDALWQQPQQQRPQQPTWLDLPINQQLPGQQQQPVLQQELPWWQHEQVHQAPQPQQQQQQLSGHQHHSTTTTMHQGDTSRKGGSTAAAAGGHRTAAGSGSSKPTGRVVSLSAAPRRPVGPDGQPITFVDGGFDHLGDCTLKYLDDTAIGIDGGLPSADAYWEGIGRCAVGPRTLR